MLQSGKTLLETVQATDDSVTKVEKFDEVATEKLDAGHM